MSSLPQSYLVNPDRLRSVFEAQRQAFAEHAPLPYARRMKALDNLLAAVLKYEQTFIDALQSDFGRRSAHETRLLEIFPVIDEIRHTRRRLRRWMRPRAASVNWQFRPSRAQIVYQPLGVVGVIGTWNYPILLTLSPLVNALAAGNHVMIKSSEIAPATAAAITRMIGECFSENYAAVVTGDQHVAAAFASLPFDHLIFTGSGRVGKMVMKAAAENLTSVTLELGGKSPALVHESFSMADAADRICSAKLWNAGQTCVAPDYALVPIHLLDEFVHHGLAVISKRFPTLLSNPNYTNMISEAAWLRMQSLLDDAQKKGAQIVQVNQADEKLTAGSRVFPPTLVLRVEASMRLMQEEIFGPILPVISYSSLEQAVAFINAGPRPLALYYFDHRRSRINEVLARTTSGGVTVNDCIFHLPQHNLPFGGIGPSGMGAYRGFDGFETFSNKKGVLLQSHWVGAFCDRLMKPPYSDRTTWLIGALLRRGSQRSIEKMSLPESFPR